MPYYKIDTKRNWEILLNIPVTDLSEEKASQRVQRLNENDTLILHAGDGTRWDRDNLLELTARPKVIVVTAGSRDELDLNNWSSWIDTYGADSICLVPYFKDDISTIQEEERKQYVAVIIGAHTEAEQPRADGKQHSFSIPLEEVVGIVRSLSTALRFWCSACYELLNAPNNGMAAGSTTLIRTFNNDALSALLQPTMAGYGWGDLFSDRSPLRDALLTHYKYGGALRTAVSRIFDRDSGEDISRTPVTSVLEGSSGAIRFLYDLAVRQGGLALSYGDSPVGDVAEMSETLTVSNAIKIIARVESELSILETALDESSIGKAVKRQAFVAETLMKAENVRANLHHERLRQNVLQRLVGAEADANLTVADESSIEETLFDGWCGLIARAEERESPDSRKSAFEAWRGGSDPNSGVKNTLLRLFADWNSDEKARPAGLVLKSEMAEVLRRAEAAVEDMDLLIGADSYWQQHRALPDDERKDAAVRFWKNAIVVMQCLGKWRNAPLRLFEIYDEI